MGREIALRSGDWEVCCLPHDGARLHRLRYAGVDLLTPEPPTFGPPATDYGRYETRPVYGYDDCFPTVDPCRRPDGNGDIPDHGDVCWLPWQVTAEPGRLDCVVEGGQNPFRFCRTLCFAGARLTWRFAVDNLGRDSFSFLPVMHGLMPLAAVTGLELPAAETVFDEIAGARAAPTTPDEVADFLLHCPAGQAEMLMLQGVASGRLRLCLRQGLALEFTFPHHLFPTLGIWWNNRGYPDEDGLRRCECAFEPNPGPLSSLAASYNAGAAMSLPPGERLEWEMTWQVIPNP